MSAVQAAALMKSHHRRIAQAVARQLRRTIPRYRQLDEVMLERNVATILGGVQQFLERGNATPLLSIVEDVARLRQMSGFSLQDFLVASLCFLPVVRQFLVEKLGDVGRGLACYEAVEAAALPLVGRVAALYAELEDECEPTIPDRRPRGAPEPLLPFTIESVVGDDALEA
jgi:hypothetical protein